MAWRRWLGELIVPAIVLLGCFLYWWHVQDARAVARRVPQAVIAFTVLMTALALVRTFFLQPPQVAEEAPAPAMMSHDVFIKRSAFVLLCFGYFLSFQWLGFNLTNLLFLLFAYRLAGLYLAGAIPAAIVSTLVFHVLAWIMDFRVPIGPFGF